MAEKNVDARRSRTRRHHVRRHDPCQQGGLLLQSCSRMGSSRAIPMVWNGSRSRSPLVACAVKEQSRMRIQCRTLRGQRCFRSIAVTVVITLGHGPSRGGSHARSSLRPPQCAPVAPQEAAKRMKLPAGFTVDPVRRRARRRAADRDDHRPQRAALGRRELLLSDLAGRARRQGPHPDLRRRRQRRPVRPPDGLLRQGDQLHRDRAGLRRRLGLRHAQPAVHPRPRRRRSARRPAGHQARRLEYEGAA